MDRRSQLFQKIPKVDRLLETDEVRRALETYPRTLVMKAIHEVLDNLREEIECGLLSEESQLSPNPVTSLVVNRIRELDRPSLRSVINATGVVVHTNLGRSLMARRVLEMFGPLSGRYTNLEYDLKEGRRGSRYVHVQEILKELTGAEDAMVVNNNAAAVLICLDTLARGREVVVSRGQLVEIGGSFRIPEVMKKSGAKMVEVGTTNKTHLRDYEEVIGPETALLMKIHRSNFQIVGFTEDVDTKDLVELGRRYGIPVMEDLGSGCFVDLSKYGLAKEPTVQEVLSEGVDLVSFSGDKLLGGPQAGIILGTKQLVDAVRKNQLNRALRIDKLTLLALEHTLRLYRDEQTALQEIPTLRMIIQPYQELRRKAQRLLRRIGSLESANFIVHSAEGSSKVGGGALPLVELPTRLVCLRPGKMGAHGMEQWLRAYDPPIICRVEKEELVLDVRTILDDELSVVARAVREMAAV
ncbi:MAG: L-seryl-tRNA(Sec) selenium transferase [Deltaproteobacteria bacterium]|nr:L-seryl-tRNA(Sec) selenium transferase [Deltaproteobacteria bacterium]MBW2082767.1 L-seryl-tRNA(Sec) selenium transferase [Deltaproteobacteria bacterium]RLB79395.1 MAG: L-seryl-tRNA(Sec) selenium transferase [Deltaproteobacteria bacterium]HDM10186.1 L-seryl-tRNA(Sec) selenium transferase [Desulfobacteraceae bacterium]